MPDHNSAPSCVFRYPFLQPMRFSHHDREINTELAEPMQRVGTKIQKIGASLRGILDGDNLQLNIVSPMAVAIGPYHHGLPELQEMEEAKHAAVEEFCRGAKVPRETVLEKIRSGAVSARSCYDARYADLDNMDKSKSKSNSVEADINEEGNGYSFSGDICNEEENEEAGNDGNNEQKEDGDRGSRFAEMMLLDGCFLLQFIASMCPDPDPRRGRRTRKKDGLMVKVHTHIDDIARDIMLLENQLPWSVLKVLMELWPEPAGLSTIVRFLDLMATAFDVGNEKGNNSSDLQQGQGRADEAVLLLIPEPDHLLDLFYRRQVVGAAHTQVLFVPKLSALSSTAVELAEMGVKLNASKVNKLGDMVVKKRKWRGLGLGLFGELSLAPMVLNKLTACWLINMAAYEACLGATQADNFAVSSSVSVLALLMNREEDVQELRSKGIVHSAFSNQETLTFFKWASRHMRVGHRYYRVFQQLHEYKQERYVWIALHRFFFNNYKILAALLSIAGVLAGLFKTILSLKQPHHQ